MTSSLVGSEMCIRDSYFGGVDGCVSRLCGVWRLWRVVGKERGGGERQWSCLLYTSDAADDM
eukprot:8037183-Prorocentrum_lima.AAC.1